MNCCSHFAASSRRKERFVLQLGWTLQRRRGCGIPDPLEVGASVAAALLARTKMGTTVSTAATVIRNRDCRIMFSSFPSGSRVRTCPRSSSGRTARGRAGRGADLLGIGCLELADDPLAILRHVAAHPARAVRFQALVEAFCSLIQLFVRHRRIKRIARARIRPCCLSFRNCRARALMSREGFTFKPRIRRATAISLSRPTASAAASASVA